MEEMNTQYQIGVDINSNKCDKDKKPPKEKIQIGTMRCLRPDNEVTDIDVASTTSQGSKISDIMKCMFFRKKETQVIEIKPEKSSASKKQSLSMDRSERSRRVLRMESMRAAPLEREAKPPDRPTTPPAAKRFLPSENPTAAFLAYVNPQNKQIRRAYSEAIKSSNPPPNDKPLHAREAFVQKHESMRSTNYRANAAVASVKKQENDDDSEAVKENTNKAGVNANITIVPGTSMSVEEEMKYKKYHANTDIQDLHDEIRRMKINKQEKGPQRRRRREGSISVSGSDTELDSEGEEIQRPKNPEPVPEGEVRNNKDIKNGNVEETIDSLYMQTQKKLDDIYQSGLGHIEGYRTESSIDEPDMTKFERDLFSTDQPKDSGVETESGDNEPGDSNSPLVKDSKTADNKMICSNFISGKPNIERPNKPSNNNIASKTDENENAENHIDSLLNEVSVWAKDRENWLLGRTELDNKYSESKDSIKLSHKVDFHNDRRTLADLSNENDEIERVRASNEQRCNNWMHGKKNTPKCSQRTIDMITSPKLFTPRNNDGNAVEKTNILTTPKLFTPRNSVKSPGVKEYSGQDLDENDKIFSPRNAMTFPGQMKDSKNNENVVLTKEEQRSSVPSKRNHKGVTVYDYSAIAENSVKSSYQPGSKDHERNKPTSILADRSNEHNKTMINGIFIPTPTFDTETEDERSTICDDLSDELNTKVRYRARSPDSWLSSCGSPANFFRKQDSVDHDFDDSLETVSSLTTDSVKVHRIAVANGPDSATLPVPKSLTRNTQLQPLGTAASFRQDHTINQAQRIDSVKGINSLTGFPSLVNKSVFKETRNLNDFEINMNSNSRPFSEIPLGTSETVDRNDRLAKGSFKYQGGYNQVPIEAVDVRPASETISAKRTDKVGFGHIMATDSNRERNRYAKEIVNNMDRKRPHPQTVFSQNEGNAKQNLFPQLEVNKPENKSFKTQTNTAPKSNQTQVAFVSQLLQGGYSYDKHSSKRLNSASGNGKSTKDSKELDNAAKDGAKASVSSTFSEDNLKMRPQKNNMLAKTEGSVSSHGLKGKNGFLPVDITINSPVDYNTSNTRTAPSAFDSQVPTSKAKNYDNSKSSVDVLSTLEIDTNVNKTTEQISHGSISTAEKFRKMRDRRNQEMLWLMKDAAETEV